MPSPHLHARRPVAGVVGCCAGDWWRLVGVACLGVACLVAVVSGTGRADEPPPMYIADPLAATGFAGIPVGTAADMLPNWPRWFAGASGLVMTRTLPAGTATMQPLGGMQLTTADAGATWPGGVDFHVGRWFGPRQFSGVSTGSASGLNRCAPGGLLAGGGIPQVVYRRSLPPSARRSAHGRCTLRISRAAPPPASCRPGTTPPL